MAIGFIIQINSLFAENHTIRMVGPKITFISLDEFVRKTNFLNNGLETKYIRVDDKRTFKSPSSLYTNLCKV